MSNSAATARASQRGFTLIEVLIAMAVTVMIVTLAFMTFTNLINGLGGLRRASDQSHEINRAWVFLARDLRQFVDRPVRDELGEQESAFYGGELADDSITFTRSGWHNPNRNLRSNLQRVRYWLENDSLWRESYAVLDRTDESEGMEVEMLEGVRDFSVAFLGQDARIDPGDIDSRRWPRNWGMGSSQRGNASPPEAIEITLDIEGFGEVRRLFQLPGGSVVADAGGGGGGEGGQGSSQRRRAGGGSSSGSSGGGQSASGSESGAGG